MNENHTIKLAEIPLGGTGVTIWNRLHEERENICEALLNDSEPASQTHQLLLQARLRRLDDALDRVMSGSYGICSNCGHSIEDAALAIDPAGAVCMGCTPRESNVKPVTGPVKSVAVKSNANAESPEAISTAITLKDRIVQQGGRNESKCFPR
jgi:RNA polymerase-binding transcription factor DksA